MRNIKFVVAGLGILLWSGTSMAAPAIVSAEFATDAPLMQNQFSADEDTMLPYLIIGPVTVSSSGSYNFREGRNAFQTDISISFHTGTFDPANPAPTQQAVFDDYGDITLNENTDYTLVLQTFYPQVPLPAAAGFVLDGPGTISGPGVVQRPSEFSGEFSGDEVLTNIIPEFVGCANSYHDVIGPFTVDRIGVYYFGATSTWQDDPLPLGMGVYEGSFDPADPYNNQLNVFPNQGWLLLEPGKNYFLVVQPDCTIRTGTWSYIMVPPADALLWSTSMAGSWYDPATNGSGIYVDVLPDLKAVSLAWFTWDTVAPVPDPNPDVADPGTRWLTALGLLDSLTDHVVEMTVYGATGGIFNQGVVSSIDPVGTLTLDMNKYCEGGEFSFTLNSGQSGTSKLQRIANDNLIPCVENGARPGVFQP